MNKHISTRLAKAIALSDMKKEGEKIHHPFLYNKVALAPIKADVFLSLSQPGKLVNF